MIPMLVSQEELLKARDGHVLCHPTYSDKEVHDDEKIIMHGDANMLSTPIECGRRALINSGWVVCAIAENGQIIINPNGQMVPDVADCINEFLEDQGIDFNINRFKWTVDNVIVPPENTTYNNDGTFASRDDGQGLTEQRNSDAKMARFYVDNVMDAVYHKHDEANGKTMRGMFSAPHERHRGINFDPSFEKENARETLYSLVFNNNMVNNIINQPGVAESGLSVEGMPIKPSTAKRLLLAYVSSKIGIPYVPIKFSELQKEVKNAQ